MQDSSIFEISSQTNVKDIDEKCRVGRHTHLAETVVVVEGLPGCGKPIWKISIFIGGPISAEPIISRDRGYR